MRRSRSSPSASSGARATWWCGTTAARCTGATRLIHAHGGSCTARRSGRRLNPLSQLLDARAVHAEVAPAEARGRAHVDHASVVVELDVVDVAQERRAEFG